MTARWLACWLAVLALGCGQLEVGSAAAPLGETVPADRTPPILESTDGGTPTLEARARRHEERSGPAEGPAFGDRPAFEPCRTGCRAPCPIGTVCCRATQQCVDVDCPSCCSDDRADRIREASPGACRYCDRDAGT